MKTEASSIPVLSFTSPSKWRSWLHKNHSKSSGIWLKFFKKNSDQKSVTYAEALDEALCYGWIDGQLQSYDEHSYLQKFTPRHAKSTWSKINTQRIERLTKSGKMHQAGLKAVEAAKTDGRWNIAYDSPKNMAIPEDFLKILAKNKKARIFFETLSKANLYSIGWRLQTAKKPETRQKWMQRIIEMLEKGETFH